MYIRTLVCGQNWEPVLQPVILFLISILLYITWICWYLFYGQSSVTLQILQSRRWLQYKHCNVRKTLIKILIKFHGCFIYRVTPVEIPDEEITVRGLVEGKPYEFRVAAINEAGPGEWAETDEAIKPQPPPG